MNKSIAYIFGNYFFDNTSDGFVFCVATNHYGVISQTKLGNLKSFLLKLMIRKFDCSICKTDYEKCPHESGSKYDGVICQPLISDMDIVNITSVPYYEHSTITDMLVIPNDETKKIYVWYGFPTKDTKTRIKNVTTAESKGWISQESSNHFKNTFSIAPNGVISYPPDASFIIELGYRLDFKNEYKELTPVEKQKLNIDPSNDDLYLNFRSEFDPERYDFKRIDNIDYAYDRFDHILIPTRETYALLNRVTREKGGNLYWIKPKEDSIKTYVANRKIEIEKSLNSAKERYQFADTSELFLSKIEDKLTLRFVILCVDIVGSTKLSLELSNEKFTRIIEIFSREIALIAENYHGYVLKNVGDGIIIYFPIPVFWGMDDNALDCAVMIKFIIENGINHVFEKYGYPRIKFRIGLDSGDVTVTSIGSKLIKQHKDLIGRTINITSKVQSVAENNEILTGHNLFQRLHTSRRKLLLEYKPKNWSYSISNNNEIYQIYKIIEVEILR
jgi:class 3 adenylate cyclase